MEGIIWQTKRGKINFIKKDDNDNQSVLSEIET